MNNCIGSGGKTRNISRPRSFPRDAISQVRWRIGPTNTEQFMARGEKFGTKGCPDKARASCQYNAHAESGPRLYDWRRRPSAKVCFVSLVKGRDALRRTHTAGLQGLAAQAARP